jgi:hypothetical protein
MNSPTDKLEHYEQLLRSVWVLLLRKRLLSSVLLSVGFALLLLTFFTVLESVFWFNPITKTTLWTVVILAGLTVGVLVHRLLTMKSFTDTYLDFSRKYNQDNLRYVLDLKSGKDGDKYGLYEDAIRQNLELIDEKKLNEDVNHFESNHKNTEFTHISYLTMGSGLILVVLMISFAGSAFQRISSPFSEFIKPNPYRFEVSPGTTILEQGLDLQVQTDFLDDVPQNVILSVKTPTESDFRQIRMDSDDGNLFSVILPSVFEDLEYFINMDEFQSEVYRVDVQLLPRFSNLNVTIEPPSYTRLPDVVSEYPFRLIEAYPGSKINLKGSVNKPLTEAVVYRNTGNGSREMNRISEREFDFEFILTSADSLWFSLTDENGLQNRNTFNFNVVLLEDQYPDVRIITPAADISMMDPTSLPIIFQISDDFGFSSVRLKYQIERSYGASRVSDGEIRLNTPSDNVSVQEIDWDLTDFNLLPMDVVRYWVEVRDNDRFSNFKMTRSGTHILTISSLTDFLLAQEERESAISDKFERFQEAYEQNQRELDELRREIMENNSETWNRLSWQRM